MNKQEKYKVGQHDIICEALGINKESNDDGVALYEAVATMTSELASFYDCNESEVNDILKEIW